MGPHDCDALWPLRPGVHAAAVGAEMVFLDVEADRYLCLPGASAAIRIHPQWRALESEDPAPARDLLTAGLILPPGAPGAPGAAFEPRAVPPRRPTASVLRDAYPGLRRRDLGPVAHAVADVLRRYRGRRLADILRRARDDRPPRDPSQSIAAVEAAVDGFHRWIPYAPLPGKCLLRSFVLLQLLHRLGLDADWVFGVATWPFRAHCWLQVEGVALDEHVDRVGAYTPILVV